MINRIYSRPPIQINQSNNSANPIQRVKPDRNFAEILNEKLNVDELKFSSHASKRLTERGISLSESDKSKLNEAVNQISEKGSKESLIIMDDVSYVVNVPNRTVITALDSGSAKNNIFTNIDSAMII